MPNPNVLLVLNRSDRAPQFDLDQLIAELKQRNISELYCHMTGSLSHIPYSPASEQETPSNYRLLQRFAEQGIKVIPVTELDGYYGGNFYLDHIAPFGKAVVEEEKSFIRLMPDGEVPDDFCGANQGLSLRYQHSCRVEQALCAQMGHDTKLTDIRETFTKSRPYPLKVYGDLRAATPVYVPILVIGNDPRELKAIQDYHDKQAFSSLPLFTAQISMASTGFVRKSQRCQLMLSEEDLKNAQAMQALNAQMQGLNLYVTQKIPHFSGKERADQIVALRNALLEVVRSRIIGHRGEKDLRDVVQRLTTATVIMDAKTDIATLIHTLANAANMKDIFALAQRCEQLIASMESMHSGLPAVPAVEDVSSLVTEVRTRVSEIMQDAGGICALMRGRIAANQKQTRVVEYYDEAVSDPNAVRYYQPAGVTGDDIPMLCVLPHAVYGENSVLLIAGDIHGNTQNVYKTIAQYDALKAQGKRVFVLFKGDLVDRAPAYTSSIEAMVTVRCFQEMFPDDVFIIPGNHDLIGSRPDHKPRGNVQDAYPSQYHFWDCELSANARATNLPVVRKEGSKVTIPPAATVLNTLPRDANDFMRDTMLKASMTDLLAIRYPCNAGGYMLVVHGAPLVLETTNGRIRLADLLDREQCTWGEKLPPYGRREFKNDDNEACQEGDSPSRRGRGNLFGDKTKENLQASGDCGCHSAHSHYNHEHTADGYTFRTSCSTNLGSPKITAQLDLYYGTGNGFDHKTVNLDALSDVVVPAPAGYWTEEDWRWGIIEQFFAEATDRDELTDMCRRVVCEKIVKTDSPSMALAVTNIAFINECFLLYLINLRVARHKFALKLDFNLEDAINLVALENRCHEILADHEALRAEFMAFIASLNEVLIVAERRGEAVNERSIRDSYFVPLHMVRTIFAKNAAPGFITTMHQAEINARRQILDDAIAAFSHEDYQHMYQMLQIMDRLLRTVEISRTQQEGFQEIKEPLWIKPLFVRDQGNWESVVSEYIQLDNESTELWQRYSTFYAAFTNVAPEDTEYRTGLRQRSPLLVLFSDRCAQAKGDMGELTFANLIKWIHNGRATSATAAQPIDDLEDYNTGRRAFDAAAVAAQWEGRSEHPRSDRDLVVEAAPPLTASP